MRRPPHLTLHLVWLAALIVGCGGGPAVLERAPGLDAADRARIVGFETTLDADRMGNLVPGDAPQRIDVRPGSLVRSGLGRYLPVLSAELGGSMRRFEDESGVPALEAFERLYFWSDALTVDALDVARGELLFAFDGATLIELIEWLDGSPGDAAEEDDAVFEGRMFVAAFSRLTPAQLARVRRVMESDPQRVETLVLGPETRLVTARGVDGTPPVAWSMWAYSWPGGFIAERAGGDGMADPAQALARLATQLRRIEDAAKARPTPPPADRVLTARIRGPDPIAVDLDMGRSVGLRVSAPAALLEQDMPPQMLVAAWPMMKLTLINGLEEGLRGSGVADFGPLLAGVIRASTLEMRGARLIWSTTLPQREFEALLPTM